MLLEQNIEKKSVSEFAADSAMLVRKLHSTKQPLILTEDGENAAVVMDSVEYALMAERLQMLEDIYIAQDELRSGNGIPHETASKDLLARYGG